MTFSRLIRKAPLWGAAMLCLLLSTGCCGCIRDILDFGVVSSGLSQPTRGLTCESKARVLDRVRWMELARRWERQLEAHALSKQNGSLASGPLYQCKQDCSSGVPSCCDCYQVDFCSGFIDLACYTSTTPTTPGLLSGKIKMDVGTAEQREGEAFFEWEQVCFPANKATDPTVKGVCLNGATSYRATINDASDPTRYDLLWAVRLWVQEGGDTTQLRLDGAVGLVYKERRQGQLPTTQRKAVYFEESSLLYSDFTLDQTAEPTKPAPLLALQSGGKVKILSSTGEYKCCFQVDPATGARTSRCIKVDTNQPLCASSEATCTP